MERTFNDLLLSCMPGLRHYALRLTRNRAAADDLVQQTAMLALRAKAQFTLGTNFKAWACRIMYNEHINNFRRTRRESQMDPEWEYRIVVAVSAQEHMVYVKEVVRAVDILNPRLRRIFKLICFEGLTSREAADVTGQPEGTVKTGLWRGRAKLRARLH
ncbi:MAG: RNA polymerase sigma factor [Rhodospirillaceae bacterium]